METAHDSGHLTIAWFAPYVFFLITDKNQFGLYVIAHKNTNSIGTERTAKGIHTLCPHPLFIPMIPSTTPSNSMIAMPSQYIVYVPIGMYDGLLYSPNTIKTVTFSKKTPKGIHALYLHPLSRPMIPSTTPRISKM